MEMVGRRVQTFWNKTPGEVIQWEPLAHGGDVLIRDEGGKECWHSSHTLQPIDGLGPLPSRNDFRRKTRQESIETLKALKAQGFTKRWAGCEFAKVFVGNAIIRALAELEREAAADPEPEPWTPEKEQALDGLLQEGEP